MNRLTMTVAESTLVRLMLISIALAVLNSTCYAQWSTEAELPWQTQIGDLALEELLERIDFDDEQREAAKTIHAKHQLWFKEFVKRGRYEMAELNRAYRQFPSNSLKRSDAETKADTRQLEYLEEQEAHDKAVLEKWKALLRDDQIPQWEQYVRWLNRIWWISRAHNYGEERVDLIALLDEMSEPDVDSKDPAALSANLDLYTERLNDLLLERAALLIKHERLSWKENQQRLKTDGTKVWIGQSDKPLDQWQAQWRARYNRERAVHRAIRDLNRSTSRIIADLLHDDVAMEYIIAYHRKAMADWLDTNTLYGRAYLNRVLDHADLDDNQQRALNDLKQLHQDRFVLATKRIVDARDRMADSQFGKKDAEISLKRFQIARDAWYNLDEELASSVFNLLSTSQQEQFPKPTPIQRAWRDKK